MSQKNQNLAGIINDFANRPVTNHVQQSGEMGSFLRYQDFIKMQKLIDDITAGYFSTTSSNG